MSRECPSNTKKIQYHVLVAKCVFMVLRAKGGGGTTTATAQKVKGTFTVGEGKEHELRFVSVTKDWSRTYECCKIGSGQRRLKKDLNRDR